MLIYTENDLLSQSKVNHKYTHFNGKYLYDELHNNFCDVWNNKIVSSCDYSDCSNEFIAFSDLVNTYSYTKLDFTSSFKNKAMTHFYSYDIYLFMFHEHDDLLIRYIKGTDYKNYYEYPVWTCKNINGFINLKFSFDDDKLYMQDGDTMYVLKYNALPDYKTTHGFGTLLLNTQQAY